MKTKISRKTLIVGGVSMFGLFQFLHKPAHAAMGNFEVRHSQEEWHKLLSGGQYSVLRESGTEAPGTSPLNHNFEAGTYYCAGCHLASFDSKTKFDSGTGWPSFYKPLPNAVKESKDYSMGIPRTEVHCRRCGSHLGHVFDDGPQPTGLRYCMNGIALIFRKK